MMMTMMMMMMMMMIIIIIIIIIIIVIGREHQLRIEHRMSTKRDDNIHFVKFTKIFMERIYYVYIYCR